MEEEVQKNLLSTKKNANGVTEAQAEFCRLRVIEGKTLLESMKGAGYNSSDDNLKKNAYNLMRKPNIRAEMTRLIDEAKYSNMANKELVKKFVLDTMLDRDLPMSQRQKSADMLAKMEGMYIETQVVTEAESHYRQSAEGWNIRKKMLLENNPQKALDLRVVTQKEYDEYLAKRDNKDGTNG